MKVIGTDFKEYTIEPRADLSEAYLEDADLRWASLRDANLYRAYLIRTDLREANLSDANLRGAVWNGETVFPKGFEIPERVGLRLLRRRL